jgi:simple sugar transport system ATP-binding protein
MAALVASGLSKRFGANTALDGVDLELVGGEVVGLMGANGAGKSTLVKILCGVYGSDAGSIRVGGKTVVSDTPGQARARGIVAVHQSVADIGVPALSVADNLLLDRYCASNELLFAAGGRKRRAARRIAEGIRLDVDLKRQLGTLSIAERQLVAIARAVSDDPAVLILDEPTASDEAHRRSAGRFTNCLGIGTVGLVPLDEWLPVLGGIILTSCRCLAISRAQK